MSDTTAQHTDGIMYKTNFLRCLELIGQSESNNGIITYF